MRSTFSINRSELVGNNQCPCRFLGHSHRLETRKRLSSDYALCRGVVCTQLAYHVWLSKFILGVSIHLRFGPIFQEVRAIHACHNCTLYVKGYACRDVEAWIRSGNMVKPRNMSSFFVAGSGGPVQRRTCSADIRQRENDSSSWGASP